MIWKGCKTISGVYQRDGGLLGVDKSSWQG